MSINDIQTELASIKKTTHNDPNKSINDTLQNKVDEIEKFLEGKVINIYSRPWNKLELKLKKIKITEYLNTLLSTKLINLDTFNILFYKLNSSQPNKLSNDIELKKIDTIVYDQQCCEITSFDYEHYL